MNKLLLAGVASSALMLSMSASAATFDFKYDSNLSKEGIDLSLSSDPNGWVLNSQPVYHFLKGYGVQQGFPNILDGSSINKGEVLTVKFNKAVNVKSIKLAGLPATLSKVGIDYNVAGDNYLYDAGWAHVLSHKALNVDLSNVTSLQLTGLNLSSHFYLKGLEVEPVPVPAAAWLLGSALFGMGVLKRRKKA